MLLGILMVLAGASLIGLFAYLNFTWEPQRYPPPSAAGAGAVRPAAVGWFEATVLFLGVIVATLGFVMLATMTFEA